MTTIHVLKEGETPSSHRKMLKHKKECVLIWDSHRLGQCVIDKCRACNDGARRRVTASKPHLCQTHAFDPIVVAQFSKLAREGSNETHEMVR